MVAGKDVGFLEVEGERFEGHGLVVGEESFADAEEIGAGIDAADFVEKTAGGFDADAEVVHVFLHLLHLRGFADIRRADGIVEGADVIQDVEAGGNEERFATEFLPDLMEEPGIADDAAADHETARAGEGQDFAGLAGGVNIAVGQDGAGQGGDGTGNEIVMDLGAVHFADGAAVHGKQVKRMFRENGQQFLEDVGRIEAEARLDGELDGNGLAQRAEDGVHAFRFAQQATAGAFAVNDGRGTAEVEVNGGHGQLLEFLRGADEGRNVVADHLRDDRLAGGILGDGFDDPFLEVRHGMDAEIFRVIDIRAAVLGHQPPERQVGDVLHRREREDGLRGVEQLLELGRVAHAVGYWRQEPASNRSELQMPLKFSPRSSAQGSLAIGRFPERFGAGGIAGAAEPLRVERFGNERGSVGGDGGFLLFAGGMTGAHVKSGEQKRNSEHRAAGISGQRAGTRGIEEAEQIGEERLRPHGRIFGGGKGVEQNRMRRGNRVSVRVGKCVSEKRREISQMEFPVDLTSCVLEFRRLSAQEGGDGFFVAVEVVEDFRVIEGELERFQGMVKTDDSKRTTSGAGGSEDGEDIRGGAEADIPDDKFTGMRDHALGQAKLVDVKRLRFGNGTDDRMKSFAMRDGMNAVHSAGELHDFVCGGRHARHLNRRAALSQMNRCGIFGMQSAAPKFALAARRIRHYRQFMKIIKMLLLPVLAAAAMLPVKSSGSSALYPVVAGGHWGYMDKTGTIAINPQFDAAEPFTAGLAPVKLGQWGYASPAGKLEINPQFDWAGPFSEGLAAVAVGGHYGFINPSGKYVINPQFNGAHGFAERLAAAKQGGRWGFIDKSGKYAINPQFDDVTDFSQGLAGVKVNGLWGFINPDGKLVVNPQFDGALAFSEDLAAVKSGKRWGYIDHAGNMVINPQFDDASPFADRLAAVRLGKSWGYIDKSGKFVINPQFDNAAPFSEGLAAAKNGHWGFVDKNGKYVINPQFDEVNSFSEGLARFSMGNMFGHRVGYVGPDGKYVWNPVN
jgi:WG containing repeat